MATTSLPETAIVGIFDDREHARAAVAALREAGFADHEIGLLTQNASGKTMLEQGEGETHVAEGAAIGVAAGAGMGALWAVGLAAGVFPVVGPAIVGGYLAAIAASAAGGAAVGGLVGALAGLGVPEHEAKFYESEVTAGRTIVTVNAFHRAAEAGEIIENHTGRLRSREAIFNPPADNGNVLGDEIIIVDDRTPGSEIGTIPQDADSYKNSAVISRKSREVGMDNGGMLGNNAMGKF